MSGDNFTERNKFVIYFTIIFFIKIKISNCEQY